MLLHEIVKALRLASDLRQVDLVERAGLTKSGYSEVERETCSLTVEGLRAIAELFGMTMDAVVDYDLSTPEGLPLAPALASVGDAERVRLIAQLPEDDRLTAYRVIDQMIANYPFREFFAEHA